MTSYCCAAGRALEPFKTREHNISQPAENALRGACRGVFDPQRKLSNSQDHRRTGTMVGCVCSFRPSLH